MRASTPSLISSPHYLLEGSEIN